MIATPLLFLGIALMVGDREEDQHCARNANVDFEWANVWRARSNPNG